MSSPPSVCSLTVCRRDGLCAFRPRRTLNGGFSGRCFMATVQPRSLRKQAWRDKICAVGYWSKVSHRPKPKQVRWKTPPHWIWPRSKCERADILGQCVSVRCHQRARQSRSLMTRMTRMTKRSSLVPSAQWLVGLMHASRVDRGCSVITHL